MSSASTGGSAALAPLRQFALPADGTETKRPNFFAPVAEFMGSIPASLEAGKATDPTPRYVRICRLRSYLAPARSQDEPIAGAMATGVTYFATGMAYLVKYSLKLEDLLVQGDAGKALLETSLLMVRTIGDPLFIANVEDLSEAVTGQRLAGLATSLQPVSEGIDKALRFIDFIPEPRDLEVIKKQLYRMLVIGWVPDPVEEAVRRAETTPVDLATTGKLRLMLWATGRPLQPIDPGAGADVTKVTRLGQRRLWKADPLNLPQSSKAQWIDPASPGKEADILFESDFSKPPPPGTADPTATDVSELQDLLRAYGYEKDGARFTRHAFDQATHQALQDFQVMNGLPETGILDLATVNQLFHIRYDVNPDLGSLRRAARFVDAGTLQSKREEALKKKRDGQPVTASSTQA